MRKIWALIALSFLISQVNAMDKIYLPAKKILLKGLPAKKEAVSYLLPKGFFIEEREGVVVEKIKENLLYVYDKTKKEKEFCLENNDDSRQFGLFHKENNLILDRRIKVQNVFDFQHRPICLLRGTYKVNDDHHGKLIYHGSGFRNYFNQIVTAGHNLYLESNDIRNFCNKRKISLKNYDFDVDLLTMELIFGLYSKEDQTYYTRRSAANGRDCFVHKNRDFGIINLPINEKTDLDDAVGSLPLALIPYQPHEYMGQDITIVGYPGEKNPKSLWYHSGPIKNIDADKLTTYDVDTTKGNSGSPGFIKFAPLISSDVLDDFSVCLVHTEQSPPFNSGQGFDGDILDFIEKNHKK